MRGAHEVTRVTLAGGRPAARKALRPELRGREELRLRLLHEGRCLARAGGHRHVLGCLAVDEEAPALLLEWAPGGSLAERLARAPGGRLPLADAGRLARELGEALDHVHAAGLVHRDVKPSNVLFADDGGARLADFGVAAPAGARGVLGPEWDEEPVGTLGYAAPEQLAGEPADPRADVHGLGALLYEVVTGRLPWELREDEDERGLRARIVAGDEGVPAERWGADPKVGAVLGRALAGRKAERYATVGEFVRDWRSVVSGGVRGGDGGTGGAPGGA